MTNKTLIWNCLFVFQILDTSKQKQKITLSALHVNN